jgi:hypothetical protein
MGSPKRHHFVPQFYLRRFTDDNGKLWVWDRVLGRSFIAKPGTIAAESQFYFHDGLHSAGHDPLTMERQFSALEHHAAVVTDHWLAQVRASAPGDPLEIPDDDRDTMGIFLALQALRTADTRDLLTQFAMRADPSEATHGYARELHLDLLWDEVLVDNLALRIASSTWVLAQNPSAIPLVTSDNPVTFRTNDNRMWVRGALFSEGTYMAYPLAPDVIMFAYPDGGEWQGGGVSKFNNTVSPVVLTSEMALSENTAHVFMASRHVVSTVQDFAWAREFAATIGTDTFAPRPAE